MEKSGDNENSKHIVKRFEEMIEKNANYYFDLESFESIIDFYAQAGKIKKL